ncbi:MAG: DUF4153 domain-containing protein [Lonepinella koalarum]|nr:DUF4153 domain-containing protein [Lonepinella koalarum]
MAISVFFTRLGQQIKFAFLQHPLEIILISVAAIPTLFLDFGVFGNLSYWLFTPIYFALIYLANGNKWWYQLSVLLPFMGTFLIYSLGQNARYYLNEPKFWAANVLLFLILIAVPFYRENRQFIHRTFLQLLNFLLACLTGWLIWGTLSILIFSIENLFDLKFHYQTYERITIFSHLFFIPLFFLIYQQKQKEIEFTAAPFVQIIIQFVLSPVLMIYTVLLYAYALQIMLLGELPKGMVANLVMPYLVIGLGIYCLQILCDKSRWIVFFRAFPYLSLLPFVLLWLALYQRIEAYAWTETRIYLVAISTTLSLCYGLLMLPMLRQYRYLLGIVQASIFIMIFLVQPKDIAFTSQSARFEQQLNALGLLNEQGKIRDSFDPKKDLVHLSAETIKQYDELTNSLHYLRVHSDFNNDKLIEKYGKNLPLIEEIFVYDGKIEVNNAVLSDPLVSDMRFSLDENDEINIQGYNSLTYLDTFYFENPKRRMIAEEIEKLSQEYTELVCVDDKGKELACFNLEQHIQNVFQKNGLDITKQHSLEVLKPLNNQFLVVENQEKGVKVIFRKLNILYAQDKGYIFDYLSGAILLSK